MANAQNQLIGIRIRARRESVGMTQDELARRMELGHRQILGAIESGHRQTKPSELVAVARVLAVSLDYFTDRFSAAGEASFSFRAGSVEEEELSAFEELAGKWMATYRELTSPSLIKQALSITDRSSFEQAQDAGEQTRKDLGLGSFPGHELQEATERAWGILVLHVDPPSGISGAASRLGGVQAVLINRTEPRARRNYDLAHELFHLLTWDTMPPARIESEAAPKGKEKRVEQLADNFAAALLMPRASMLASWKDHEHLPLTERIVAMAAEAGVSGPALKYRLLNLGLAAKADLPDDAEIAQWKSQSERPEVPPLPFNASFINVLHRAVEEGTLSVRKASRILGTDTAGLGELFRSYGRQLSYEI